MAKIAKGHNCQNLQKLPKVNQVIYTSSQIKILNLKALAQLSRYLANKV